MELCDTQQSKHAEGCKQQEAVSPSVNLSEGNLDPEKEDEEEEDEEEDVDFNPFMKETTSPEAFSSLSSDDEGAGKTAGSVGSPDVCKETVLAADTVGEERVGDSDRCDKEETVMQSVGVCGNGKKRKMVGTWEHWRASKKAALKLASGEGVSEGSNEGVNRDPMNSVDGDMDSDNEDAICRRTRARYSLANFSLDELETFLQETDDEDLQNVDDEEEYKKFLAAVLQDEEDEDQSVHEDEIASDEDEDSDADFEIELEEALDSDFDENTQGKKNRERGSSLRPNTIKIDCNNRCLGQPKRQLRPIVPLVPSLIPPPSLGGQALLPGTFLRRTPSPPDILNGFTPHQIGQLHCLIHEHTQLLVQVFSLCVLDPSRQQIANETLRLISELDHKRVEVLSWRKVPYPEFYFRIPYIHPSISDGLSGSLPSSIDFPSSSRQEVMGNDGGNVESLRTTNSPWVPLVSGTVLSILDVPPLRLVKSYIDDVSRAVREHKKRHVEGKYDSQLEKQPFFPIIDVPTCSERSNEASGGDTTLDPMTGSSSLKVPLTPKKNLAASHAESISKQSVAFAPKGIVMLAQRFYPLFNSALYPLKPPAGTIANRVLFTEKEDELLAMGMMEYNTDWDAVQKRFLPCKSKHQIFVRQKNRCSSKAPENPIKAVRQMKTSPLTTEEVARIHQALTVFRSDWISVWKYVVPYRDPSLLQRQWRTAIGTQKSYKLDEAKREKRRLYEKQKRRQKSTNQQTGQKDNLDNNSAEENKNENDNMEGESEAYVHEAFLADWRPGNSKVATSEFTTASADRRKSHLATSFSQEDSCGGLHPENNESYPFNIPQHLQNVSHFSHVTHATPYSMPSNHSVPACLSKCSKNQVSVHPRRGLRKKDVQLVKLAPDLPPVNLPSSVRVVSQSAFKSYRHMPPPAANISNSSADIANLVPSSAPSTRSERKIPVKSAKKGSILSSEAITNGCQENPRVNSDQIPIEDNRADIDLQMHPLLFQAPESGPLAYCPAISSASSSTFNFIAGNQLQANFSHFCKPSEASSTVNGFYTSLSSRNPSKSHAIDFHPLLQREDDEDFTQLRISSDSGMTAPNVTSGRQAIAHTRLSSSEAVNELDLEMHLSSSSRDKHVTRDRTTTWSGCSGSRNGLLNIGVRKETILANTSNQERNGNCTTPSFLFDLNSQDPLDDDAMVLPDDANRITEDNECDQSLPEIVMEQEELSDSEEENGEDVEFECEEIDDSEREDSDCK